jgi:hypothetical protein
LRAPRLPALDEILTPLINQLSESPSPIALVLDDYHLIEATAVHHAVSFLIDHQPGPLHLIVASRADPPLPLPRLRGHDQLLEFRQSDLRFTPDEAAQFLAQTVGQPLPAAIDSLADVATRHGGTGGGDGPQQLGGESGQSHRAAVGRRHLRSQSECFVRQRRSDLVDRIGSLRDVAKARIANYNTTNCFSAI